MESGELEAFLAVADELHFGRAAERLLISQPRVSQLIRSLERRIGGELFQRTSRKVSLTELGRGLHARVKPLHDALELALDDTRAAAGGLRIGFMGGLYSCVSPLVREFKKQHPGCWLTLTETPWTDFFGPLHRGEVDLQITFGPVHEPGLEVGPVLARYRRLLAVRTDHRLAGREALTLEDLAGERLVRPPDATPAPVIAGYVPAQTTSGHPIRAGHVAYTQQEAFTLVYETGEVCLTSTATVAYYRHPGLEFIPITGLPDTEAVPAWRPSARADKASRFIALAPPAATPDP